jgi:hypothetical protein
MENLLVSEYLAVEISKVNPNPEKVGHSLYYQELPCLGYNVINIRIKFIPARIISMYAEVLVGIDKELSFVERYYNLPIIKARLLWMDLQQHFSFYYPGPFEEVK